MRGVAHRGILMRGVAHRVRSVPSWPNACSLEGMQFLTEHLCRKQGMRLPKRKTKPPLWYNKYEPYSVRHCPEYSQTHWHTYSKSDHTF